MHIHDKMKKARRALCYVFTFFMIVSSIAFLIAALFLLIRPKHNPSHSFSDQVPWTLQQLKNQSLQNAQFIVSNLIHHVPWTFLTFLTAHNAYASTEHGYSLNAQQNVGILKQLQLYSARALELDTYVVDTEVYVCHSECKGTLMKLQAPFASQGETLLKQLQYVVQFLHLTSTQSKDVYKNNFFNLESTTDFFRHVNSSLFRHEDIDRVYELLRRPPVITLFMEDYVLDDVSIDQVIETSGLAPFVFTSDDYLIHNRWPTLYEMILLKKPVIIFSSLIRANSTNILKSSKFMFQYWALVRSTMFEETLNFGGSSNINLNGTYACSKLRGGSLDTELLEMHYHPALSIHQDYDAINNATLFSQFVQECALSHGFKNGFRNPNFVNADAIDQGTLYETGTKAFLDAFLHEWYIKNYSLSNITLTRTLPRETPKEETTLFFNLTLK